ncbi:MAG: phage tail tape measure protein [Pseudomonadota bacterium]
MDADAEILVSMRIDTTAADEALKNLSSSARSFATSFNSALRSAVLQGKDLDEVLKTLALNVSNMALKAALKPLDTLVGSVFEEMTPFAKGGIVRGATAFQMGAGQLGVMGERGAEAILPLARGPDGSLGVSASATMPVAVNVTIQTPDPAAFQRSEGQVSATLARAVSRGMRHL